MSWYKLGRAVFIGVVAFLILMYCAATAFAQSEYGRADFSSSQNYNRENIRGEWDFNPGTQGDSTDGQGDFEAWTGAEGGCSDCPTGFVCTCTSGDVTQESTLIYRTNTSMKYSTLSGLDPLALYLFDFAANTAYQVTFWYRGDAGTEDLVFAAGNTALTETYNFDTDTWTAPVTSAQLLNVPATWTRFNGYVLLGAAAKVTTYGFAFWPNGNDGTGIYIDSLEVKRLDTVGVVGRLGNVLTPDVGSDQVFGASEVLMQRVGTGPAGRWGLGLGGDDDLLERADDDTFDPVTWDTGGSFTVGCRVMTDTIVGVHYMISKHLAAGQFSWTFYTNVNSVYLNISNDGINQTILGRGGFGVDRLHTAIVRYSYDGINLSADANLYLDEIAVAASAVMRGPPFNSSANLNIGAYASGTSQWDGIIGHCTIWEGDIGAIDANKWRNPYFPGNTHGDGFYVDNCTQAASHATCSHKKCRDGTPVACQAEGTGVMPIFGPGTELCEDNSFENFTGDDSNPDWAKWIETESPGDGTAELTAYRADVFHKDIAVRMKTTGTTSYTRLDTLCMTTSVGSPLYVYLRAKKISGTGLMVYVREYSDAGCTSYTGSTLLVNEPEVEKVWTVYGAAFDGWDGGTNSYKIRIQQFAVEVDMLIDTVSVRAGSYFTPWGENPSGSTSFTARDYRLHNVLSDYTESEAKLGFEDGFCIDGWLYTDWAGGDSVQRYAFGTPTATDDQFYLLANDGSNNISFTVNHPVSANWRAVYASINATSWSAGEHYVEICMDNSTLLKGRWYNSANSTWYQMSSTSGAGAFSMTNMSNEFHLGSLSGAGHIDGYVNAVEISPYSAIWPMKSWNNGRMPMNGRKPY